MNTATLSLKESWNALKAEEPRLRIRNAAEKLGVTEVQLLATGCGEHVTRLRPDFKEILTDVGGLGRVMALTRNAEVVHERKGEYLNPTLNNPHVGLFVGEDIDLRIFFQSWKSAFAVTEDTGKLIRRSLQFFAVDGEAIHKIYLTPQSNEAAFEALVAAYQHEDQSHDQPVGTWPAPSPELPDGDIEVEKFQEAWRNLKDTHDFFGLLKRYKLTRTQALRLAPQGNYAVRVKNKALRYMLELVSERGVEIMVFVGNKGMIQIHSGPAKKLLEHGEWYNVLDPAFNLHVRETAIAQSWVVRKPTEDGVVTALECFDEKGNQIVQFFGRRKPGIPELTSWRAVMDDVETNLKERAK